jgi:deoxycytidine triphosphate deaminase
MKLLSSDDILDLTDNIIHENTQLHDQHLDLTVAEVHRLTSAGSLDFGGSEFTPAKSKLIDPKKINPNDSYGWWNLKIDTYKAVFNESVEVPENIIAVMTPHIHAEKSGIIINTLYLSAEDDLEDLSMYFHVPVAGCKIKENARIATLRYLKK